MAYPRACGRNASEKTPEADAAVPRPPAGCRQKRQSCAQARGSTPDCEILLKAASLRRKPLTPHRLFPMLSQPAAPAVPLRPFHFPAPSAQQAEALRPRPAPAPCFSPGATSCPAFGRAMDSPDGRSRVSSEKAVFACPPSQRPTPEHGDLRHSAAAGLRKPQCLPGQAGFSMRAFLAPGVSPCSPL